MLHSTLLAEIDPFYEGFAFGAVVGAIGLYLYLAIKGPPSGMVSAAIGVWALGVILQPGNSREMNFAVGMIRLTGCIGTVLGVIVWLFRRKQSSGRTRE